MGSLRVKRGDIMERGSLIIYDNEGTVWYNSGDTIGNVLEHVTPSGLPYIITAYGQLDGKILKGINPVTKELITENIPISLTDEQRIQELEDQLLLSQEGLFV